MYMFGIESSIISNIDNLSCDKEKTMNKSYERLIEIRNIVKKDPQVLCLLGLGSMSELNRLDAYSDIDFFLIVQNGTKHEYLVNLKWMESQPIAYAFRNTQDGYKVLYEDGVFAEFAVFDQDEIKTAHYSKGHVFYIKEGFNASFVEPKHQQQKKTIDKHFLTNEALTNLYVGLQRELRGEKASATTFIQGHAYQNIIQLFPLILREQKVDEDLYVYERRIEQRFLQSESIISSLRPGYDHNVEAAKFALDFLDQHFEVDDAMKREIQQKIDQVTSKRLKG